MTRLKQDKVDQLLTRCRREVDEGLLPSCQVALGIDGKVEVFETFGNESNDTRYIIFSSTKAFVRSAARRAASPSSSGSHVATRGSKVSRATPRCPSRR